MPQYASHRQQLQAIKLDMGKGRAVVAYDEDTEETVSLAVFGILWHSHESLRASRRED